jgi:Ca2+-transporting ATPase
MPLLPVQLLWLNLVTNGVQHIALAAEKPEGDELTYPPRRPQEPIFDRVMIVRNVYSAFVMAGVGFAVFYWLINNGYATDSARNLLLLLFVVFENFQALNARSEHHSLFYKGLFSSPLLLASVIGAQVLHLLAAHIPVLADTLRIEPPTLAEWGALLALGSTLLVVMELEKWWGERHKLAKAPPEPEAAVAQAGLARRYAPVAAGLALLVAVAAVGTIYWQSKREGARDELATVDRGEISRTDDAARLAAPPPPVEASAPVSGTIEAVACRDGEVVEAGLVCARIIPPDLAEALARARKALAAAQAAQAKAEAGMERAKTAHDRAVSRRDSNATKAKARAAAARAEARLTRARTETTRREEALRATLEKGAPVAAPGGGTVGESRLEAGKWVQAGVKLFQIAPAR